MSGRKVRLKFLLDEGVPDSVGTVLESHGHEVLYLNRSEVVIRGSPDQHVASTAIVNDCVLVALDGDMRKIARENGYGRGCYKKLSLIKLSCSEPRAPGRVKEFMSLIHHEWEARKDGEGRRVFIEIHSGSVKSIR